MSGMTYFIIMLIITVLVLLFLLMWNRGYKKYEELLEALDSDKHPLKIIYPFGFQVLDLLNYNYTSKMDRKYIGYCKVFYGEENGQFYYCINLTQKISVSYVVLCVGVVMGLLMDSMLIVLFAIGASVGIAYYYHTLITDIIGQREESIMMDFPEVLSKLALLVNAGMILNEAWAKVSSTDSGILYQEMENTVFEMQNGVSEFDAYINFARRCSVPAVTKFASTLVQNLEKGNKELVEFLRTFSEDSWNERRQTAKRKGEEASTKLLLPICLMLLGIMIMIMIPIFTQISM